MATKTEKEQIDETLNGIGKPVGKGSPAKPKQPKNKNILELPVTFGTVSFGANSCRVGVTISRGNLTALEADEALCGRRLTGKIVARPEGASAEQSSLPGLDGDRTVVGVFDVKSVGFNPSHISCGLTFSKADVSNDDLTHFAKREGLLVVNEIADLPKDEADEADDEE